MTEPVIDETLTTCTQCRDIGIDVEYSKTFVNYLVGGGGYCKLCGYTLTKTGIPVISTIRKVNKEGSRKS